MTSAGRLTWVGHATTLIELAGVRLLTDPVLRSRVLYLRRVPPPPDPAVSRDLDAILISHLHHDHLDRPSLRRIDPRVPLIGPPGTAKVLRWAPGRGRQVIELRPGQSQEVGGTVVRAVHAEHDGRRLRLGPPRQALGYLIEPRASAPGDRSADPGRSIWFVGDTDLHPELAELAPVGVAVVPIWGWGRSIGPGHFDSLRAARAVATVEAKVAVPIHWGTLMPVTNLSRGWFEQPGPDFARAVSRVAPQVEARVLHPGESLELP